MAALCSTPGDRETIVLVLCPTVVASLDADAWLPSTAIRQSGSSVILSRTPRPAHSILLFPPKNKEFGIISHQSKQ